MAKSTKLRIRRQVRRIKKEKPLFKTAVFRCDSSQGIGGGHVFRCIALAQQFSERRIRSEFVIKNWPGHLAKRLKGLGYKVHFIKHQSEMAADAAATLKVIGKRKGCVIIADNYSLNEEWERQVSAQTHLIVIDDATVRRHSCNMLICPGPVSLGSAELTLDPSREAVCLVGPKYSILRKEFLKPSRKSTARKGLVVFFGAYDGVGETLRFLKEVVRSKSTIPMNIIVSPANKYLRDIRNLDLPRSVQIVEDPKSLSSVWSSAKLYLGSGGTVTAERVLCDLPGVVVSVADNQIPLAESLDQLQAHRYLGVAQEQDYAKALKICNELMTNSKQLRAMAVHGRRHFGAVTASDLLLAEKMLTLRPAEQTDAKFLYRLRRDRTVAAVSIQRNKFSFSSHVNWLKAKLADGYSQLSIVMYRGEPCGQVRIDGNGIVSISLLPQARGLGIATRALKMALKIYRLRQGSPALRHTAYIRPDNLASIRAFTNAGFEKHGFVDHAGESLLCFTYETKGNAL